MKRQRGQVLAYLAVVVPLLLLPMTAYAVEASRIAAVQARLQAVAAAAAEDGAQQVDQAGFRAGGPLQPDAALAGAQVNQDVRASEPGANVDSVSVAGTTVAVQLSEPVRLAFGGFLGPASVTVRARAAAHLVAGY